MAVRQPDTISRERATELARAWSSGTQGPLGTVLGRMTAVDQVGIELRVETLKKRSIKKASKLWALDLAGIAGRVAARSAELDGEIVVVDEAGRLDEEELARRLSGEPGRSMSYLAFDLLHLDGRLLLHLALDRRRALLRQVLRPGDEVVAVPAVPTDGRALYEAVTAQGLRGIRARQRTSPYLPGVRSRLWRTVEVGGVGASQLEQRVAAAQMAAATDIGGGAGGAGRSERVLSLIRRLPLEFEDEGLDGGATPAG